ncbi:ATP-binding cassette domain-containing protein [Halomicronema hongdechloris]|nr:ATP-binding cassette domain-containing protein [Halomicronema hongdechloris]
MSSQGPAMIEMEQLSVSYRGAIALDDVSLQLYRGQQVGLIGPNGAGKSTLIKAMLGLVPHRGRVRFWG